MKISKKNIQGRIRKNLRADPKFARQERLPTLTDEITAQSQAIDEIHAMLRAICLKLEIITETD